VLGAVVWIASASALYGPVLVKLARDWSGDPAYSHGFVVIPIAAWLLWQQRERWRSTADTPQGAGLAIVIASLGVFALGILGAELFLTRVSLIGVLAGTIVYARGWRHLRIAAFALAFLIFMIPIPSIVMERLAVWLQLVASQLSEHLIQAAGVPVLRDGNVLTLANGRLDVNEACSGIHSVVALLMTATLLGRMMEAPAWRRVLLVVAAIPVAIALNGARVAATAIAVSHVGITAAQGLTHDAFGWVAFVGALGTLALIENGVRAMGGRRPLARIA